MTKALIVLFLASLLPGQLGSITVAPGVVIYAHDAVGVLVLLVFAAGAIRNKLRPWPKLTPHIAAFVGIAALSLFANLHQFTPQEVWVSSLYLVRWVAYALVYVALVGQSAPSLFLLRGLFLTGVLFSALGLVQYFLYPSLQNLWYLGWDPHYFRLFSTFLDPNFAGIFIVLTFFLGIFLYGKKPKVWWWIIQSINLIALYLTYSRSSLLAVGVAMLLWIVMQKQWKMFLVLIAAASIVIAAPKPGGDTLRILRVDSTVSRLENWQMTFARIRESPLIGHGFNTLRFRPIYNPLVVEEAVVSKAQAGADSSILFLGVTTGLLGVVAYGWLIYAMSKDRPLILFSWVAVLTHSLFVNSMFYPWVLVWFWILAAATEKSTRADI